MLILKALMRAFDSIWHVYGLVALLIVLVVLPLAGVHISQFIELVGGNYTNVISALAASIAASSSIKTRQDHHLLKSELTRVRHLIDPKTPTDPPPGQ